MHANSLCRGTHVARCTAVGKAEGFMSWDMNAFPVSLLAGSSQPCQWSLYGSTAEEPGWGYGWVLVSCPDFIPGRCLKQSRCVGQIASVSDKHMGINKWGDWDSCRCSYPYNWVSRRHRKPVYMWGYENLLPLFTHRPPHWPLWLRRLPRER